MITSITSVSSNTAAATNTKQHGLGHASLQIVTASCHGVLNTQFIAPSPKPSWFDDLNAKLDAAKVLANQWIDDIAPKIDGERNSHVIDYGATYTALTDQIVDLLNKNPNANTDNPVVQQVFALISALHDEIETIITDVIGTQEQLKIWGDAMQKSHDDLFAGAANIQSLCRSIYRPILAR